MTTQTEIKNKLFDNGVLKKAGSTGMIVWLLALSWSVFQYSAAERERIDSKIQAVRADLHEFKLESTKLVTGLPTMYRIDSLETGMRSDLKSIAVDIVRLREDVSAIKQRVGP